MVRLICIIVFYHRRRSSVNFGVQDIFAQKLCIKIKKIPEFYVIYFPEMSHTDNCPKSIFPDILCVGKGGTCPLCLPSPTSTVFTQVRSGFDAMQAVCHTRYRE